MPRQLEKVGLFFIKGRSHIGAKLLSSLIVLHFLSNIVVGYKNIQFCDDVWKELGKEMAECRERCFNRDVENDSPCCQAEKEYFEERRLFHKQMCFYEDGFKHVAQGPLLKVKCSNMIEFSFDFLRNTTDVNLLQKRLGRMNNPFDD